MAKIDRLGWAAGLAFESYGVRVGVRTNDPAALERLSSHLPPGWRPARTEVVERLYSLFAPAVVTRARGVRRFNLLYGDVLRLAHQRPRGARTPVVASAAGLEAGGRCDD